MPPPEPGTSLATRTRPPNIAGPEDGRAQSLYSSGVGLLVADLAANMEPLPTILRRYELTKGQLQALMQNDTFRQAIRNQKSLFAAAANLPHRIQLKAQLAVEELMGDMIGIASNSSQPGAARVAAYAKLQALTGLERPEAPQPKPKFGLTINVNTSAEAGSASSTLEIINSATDEAVDEGISELSLPEPLTGLAPEPEGHRGGWRAGIASPLTIGGAGAELRAAPKPFERKTGKAVSIIGLQGE